MSGNRVTLNLDDIKSFITKLFSNRKMLGKGALILVILAIAMGIRMKNLNDDNGQVEVSEATDTEVTTAEMYVDISGEVEDPGVYIVEDGTRLYEVIEKAGGLTEEANTDAINQAGYVEDGEKIVIPSEDGDNAISTDVSSASAGSTSSSGGTKASQNGLININTAGKDQLMEITGVGEVTADKIIEYRKNNRFKSIEDIMNVSGIGSAKFESMKSEITV